MATFTDEERKEGRNAFLIYEKAQACLGNFETVTGLLEDAKHAIEAELSIEDIRDDIREQHILFVHWNNCVDASKMGLDSLDYKLRDIETVRLRIVRLLKGVARALEVLAEIIRGEREVPIDEDGPDSNAQLPDDHDGIDDPETLSIVGLLENIEQYIDEMKELTNENQTPFPFDLEEAKEIDIGRFENQDIEYVSLKFPGIGEDLKKRLTSRIAQRRQYLQYWNQCGSKELFTVDKIKRDSMIEIEHTTSTLRGLKYQPPLRPNRNENGTISCPVCYRVTPVITDTHQWHTHVYDDLKPYVCTFKSCNKFFETCISERAWVLHEIDHMGREMWDCREREEPLKPGEHSTSQSKPTKPECSKEGVVGEELDLAPRRRFEISQDGRICPLCNKTFGNYYDMLGHLGQHMRDMALYALYSHLVENEKKNAADDECTARDG